MTKLKACVFMWGKFDNAAPKNKEHKPNMRQTVTYGTSKGDRRV